MTPTVLTHLPARLGRTCMLCCSFLHVMFTDWRMRPKRVSGAQDWVPDQHRLHPVPQQHGRARECTRRSGR